MSTVSVPPISSVAGVSSTSAIAVRAAYDGHDSAYHPSAPRVYEDTAAARSPRRGRSIETIRPSTPMAISSDAKT